MGRQPVTIRERDIRIWLLRRGDGLTLRAIGEMVNLHPETVRQRLSRLDYRVTTGWVRGARGGTPRWFKRLRVAGALAGPYGLRPPAYEAFESTDPKRSCK